LSRPIRSPLEKNSILIAALEGRLIFRDNSIPPKEDPSFFSGLSPTKKGEEKELIIGLTLKKDFHRAS